MKYIIVQTEKKVVKCNKLPQNKDITFIDNGDVNFKKLNGSKLPKLISKIPKVNQNELIKKGNTRFAIITKTYISLSLDQDESYSNSSE